MGRKEVVERRGKTAGIETVSVGLDPEKEKEVMSLSIEETNKLRAKLGLKPLNVSTIVVEDETPDLPGELIPGDRDKTRHLVPQHWGERDQQKKLREKLGLKKEQRQVKSKLAVVKGLGESDSEDDDAGKWVER